MLVNLAHKTDTLEDLKRGLAKLSASQDTHSENVKSIKEMQSNIDDTLHAEQLMERFVRGDQSRTTEGSGLGLSIARSLTELQGGTFELAVDGDLFKATVTMPQSG